MAMLMILSLAAAILVYHAAATATVSSEAGLYPTLQQREFPLFHHTQARTHQGQGVSFPPFKSAGNSASVALVYHQDNPSQATQSYTTVNQHFPTFPFSAHANRNVQSQSVAASNQIPFASQHGYMILAPVNPITNAGLYLPNINNNYYPQQTQQQNQIALPNNVYIPARHPQPKLHLGVVPTNQQKLKPPPARTNQQPSIEINSPLFHHQVYHPLHTSVKQNNNSKSISRPRLSPPPPKIYRNFHAMTPISRRPPPRQHLRKQAEVEEDDEEQEDERAQVNESDDDEEENENIEEEDEDDDDKSNLKDEENDNYRPYNYHPRYRNHDDDDDDDGDHDSYHHSETRPKESKLSSGKHIYPKDRQISKSISGSFGNQFDVQQFIPPFQREPGFPGPAFRHPKPKVEVKMYKYVKSSAPSPSEKEFIEGKGSEIKPVVQQNKKMYEEKWIISSKSSSNSF